MTAYADQAALTAWLAPDALPANAARLLRSATIRVARACNRSPYMTPTGTDVQPLADATCAQVASWAALGIDPDELGIGSAPVKGSKVLTGDVSYDTTGQAQAQQLAATKLCPEAEAILIAADLLWQAVPIGAPGDPLPQWGQGPPWWPGTEPMSGEVNWAAIDGEWPFA